MTLTSIFSMQLEQIRDKAYSDAIRRVPNPSFGASIHEYGETEQEVLKHGIQTLQ